MSDASNPNDDDPLGRVVESFLARFRRGERPAIMELLGIHPHLAGELGELIPAIVELERFGDIEGGHGDSTPERTSLQRPSDDSPLPKRLGDYLILRQIGGGGMGVVYEAEHESLKSRVALKVIHPRFRGDPKYLRRFHAEARVAAGLHHTNVVSVFDYGDHDGVCYYAMQYIKGTPLNQVLADLRRFRVEGVDTKHRAGLGDAHTGPEIGPAERPSAAVAGLLTGRFASVVPASEAPKATEPVEHGDCQAKPSAETFAVEPYLSAGVAVEPTAQGLSLLGELDELRYFREIARLGAQAAEAMEYAHCRGVLHRDIKPSNLLLDGLGNLWITDFGLAKREEGDEHSHSRELVGTLRYMAPERLRGKSDRRGDIYSLGATLYELLTLRPPFEEPDQVRLMERIRDDAPVPPRQVDRKIPRDLETIVVKALAKNPRDRFGSAGELADELRRFVDRRPIRSRPVSVVEHLWRWCKRDPWLAGANVAAALLMIVLAVVSSVAAVVYRNQARALSVERARSDATALDARSRAVDAYTAQAQAGRFSGRPGRRFGSLEAVTQATKLLDGLPPGPETVSRHETLRDLAIACLALPDVKPTGRVFTRPPGAFTSTFDLTMTRYAVRFRNGTISVRRVADDHEIARFWARGDREISFFGFSGDGRYLATTHHPGDRLTVWDVDSGRVAVDHTSPVYFAAARFSPDGRHFALATTSREVFIYDLATGRPNRRFRLPGVGHLNYRPDGAELAVIDQRSPSACRILDVKTGRLIRTVPLRKRAEFVAWSPDGTTLALSGDFKVDLCAAATGAQRAFLEGFTNSGIRLAYHRDGSILASQDWSGQIRLWDSVLGRELVNLNGAGEPEISEDGRIVVSQDDGMTIYQVDPAAEYRTFTCSSPEVKSYSCPSVRYDGRLFAVGTTLGVVLWDLARGTELAFLQQGKPWHALFDGSGDLITSGRAGVQRWPVHLDAGRGELRVGPPQPILLPGGNGGIAIDRSGRIVAKADFSHAYIANPERTVHIGPLNDCRGVAVSPDGQWLATGTHVSSHGAQVWRIADLTKVAELPIDAGTSVEFSTDGKWLMTSGFPCRLWDVGTWREARRIGDSGGCLSPDGRLAVVQQASKVIRLVETQTGRTLARLESPDLCAIGPMFTPDGSRLVVTTSDGPAMHVWDLRAIRRRLAGMGLDWDAPPYSDDDQAPLSAPPILRTQIVDFEYAMSRAEELAYEGQWEEASALYGEAFTYPALDRAQRWFERAVVCLAVGDSAGYRLCCQHMLDVYRGKNEQSWLEFTAHACALATDPSVDRSEALALAERRADLVRHVWSEHIRELALYRAGRYAEVQARLLARVVRDPPWRLAVLDWLVLAMAQQGLGHERDAHRWLKRAENWIAQNSRDRPGGPDRAIPTDVHWRDGILMHLLLREARSLIDPRLPDLPEDVLAPETQAR